MLTLHRIRVMHWCCLIFALVAYAFGRLRERSEPPRYRRD